MRPSIKNRGCFLVGAIVAGLITPSLFAEITPAEEREIALWVLRLGGQLMVEGVDRPIADPFDLPKSDFRIVVVDMHGTVTEPKELERLKKISRVRELYIPDRVWRYDSAVKAPFVAEAFSIFTVI